ncbi:hypothetical protein QBC47DRAFT_163386 [Echria macrotheca]|uniref:Mucin n=1 Tax=Echria macrotheca TaxID=438768 RepID=A0AAJ0BIW5_9PEZI|nr:hypothetical protein QBC47DRAFT_163386 [Echria macrotheca]
MGGLAFVLEQHDGAISSTATCPATANGVEAFDAPDTNGMPRDRLLPWLLFDATAATPAVRGYLESLTPQTSPSFDFVSDLSFRLPLFNNIAEESAESDVDQQHQADETGLDARSQPDPNSIAGDNNPQRHPFYTFFFSSASTLSLDSCNDSRTSSFDSGQTEQTIKMPGATIDFPAVGTRSVSSTDEYFGTPNDAGGDATTTTTQWRPHSAQSGTSGSRRPVSPIFARWAKRHHHHHNHRHGSGQLQAPSGRGSSESKAGGGNASAIVKRSPVRSRSSSMQKRQSHLGSVPQMTREEFEALPLAIQRKYFSTLERLRFARDSGHVDGISQHYDEITHFKRRKPRQDRSVSEQISSRIIRRSSLISSQYRTPEPSPSCATLPDKVEDRDLTREEQVVLARRLRASVILDAADEAICKLNRRASKRLAPDPVQLITPVSSRRGSMDSQSGPRSPPAGGEIPQSFYDTFRWLDEEDDLDLRLFLDDYHANLREDVPSQTKQQQRPSFRRHLSITKIPFGRNSLSSSSRPATKDATSPTSPLHSPSASGSNAMPHTRRKSRALSLITPKHGHQDSITAFDPSAAHYQDPEARLKLRVYLASPQKFDEAIEFGFPSADVLSAAAPAASKDGPANQRRARQKPSDGSTNMRTFLADFDDDDDNISLNSDQASLADPDSPKTPQAFDSKPGGGAIRPLHVDPAEPPVYLRDSGGSKNASEGGPFHNNYAQAPASSREMTLRMTLTRPDLRAHEEQIYGWQYQQHQRQGTQQQLSQAGRKSTTLGPLAAMESVTYINGGATDAAAAAAQKESLERLAAFDWGSVATTTTTDKGVMKRIWNRVRRA